MLLCLLQLLWLLSHSELLRKLKNGQNSILRQWNSWILWLWKTLLFIIQTILILESIQFINGFWILCIRVNSQVKIFYHNTLNLTCTLLYDIRGILFRKNVFRLVATLNNHSIINYITWIIGVGVAKIDWIVVWTIWHYKNIWCSSSY